MWILEICIGLALCKSPSMVLIPTEFECKTALVQPVQDAPIKTHVKCRLATDEELVEYAD